MSSYVNREVSLFNMKLEKSLNPLNCMSLIMTDCFRENFTKHGMHLNSLSKLNVSRQIVKCVHTMINKEVRTLIKLGWRTEYETVDCDASEVGSVYASPASEVTEHNTVDSDVIEMGPTYAPIAASVLGADILDKCTRRKSMSRSSDFLWGN
jgi:hypothetical protein